MLRPNGTRIPTAYPQIASEGPLTLPILRRQSPFSGVRGLTNSSSKALRAFFDIRNEPLPFCKSRNVYEPALVIRQDTNTNLED